MNEKIKASNVVTLFVVAHLGTLAMAWVAYELVAKSYPQQMYGQSERMQLIPIDSAMLSQKNSVAKVPNQHKH